MLSAIFNRTLRPFGMPPIRAGNIAPPVVVIAEVDASPGFLKDDRRRLEHLRQSSRIIFRFGRTLSDSDVVRRLNKARELIVGYRESVDPEALNRRGVRRRLFGIVIIGSNLESAAGDPDHLSAGS